MKLRYILIFIIAVLVSSCNPTKEVIQTAIAQTAVAQVSKEKPTVQSTETPIPFTPTIITSIGNISIQTQTPTFELPKDTRVVLAKPVDLVLQKSDLPIEGKYYLPNQAWSSPITNDEIINEMGREVGSKYTSESGRVAGWFIGFAKPSLGIGSNYPFEIATSIIQYKTVEGSQNTITKDLKEDCFQENYGFSKANSEVIKENRWEEITISSNDIALIKEKTVITSPDSLFNVGKADYLFLQVAHKNYLVQIWLVGVHGSGQNSKELASDLAMKTIEKIDVEETIPAWKE
jgi:hypothetical protein